MLRYCTECGTSLEPGSAFCVNCGTKIERKEADTFPAIRNLAGGDHPQSINKNSTSAICLTNSNRLSSIFGDTINNSINHFITLQSNNGINYHLIDVSNLPINHDVHEIINLLNKKFNEFKMKSQNEYEAILIIGDSSIIPMKKFTNNIPGDPDRDMDSDFPYSILSGNDPWMSPGGTIEGLIPVGRIPLGTGFGLEDFKRYQENLHSFTTNQRQRSLLGLSAQVWRSASQEVFQSIEGSDLNTSPPIENASTTEELISSNPDFLYFNLHGSDQAPGWYGDNGNRHPEVVVPGSLSRSNRATVVGVEACYGARFLGLNKHTSILLNALSSGCVALAGSSRIAFGPCAPPIALADVIVQRFLQAMIDGKPAGIALQEGRMAVLSDGSPAAHQRKTILEFNLFGDPLAALPASGKPTKGKQHPKGLSQSGMKIPMPDVLGMVRSAINANQKRIKDLMDAHVGKVYPGLKGIEPEFFQGQSSKGGAALRFVYSKTDGPVLKMVMIDTDPYGNILNEFQAK